MKASLIDDDQNQDGGLPISRVVKTGFKAAKGLIYYALQVSTEIAF